ncbi:hypothetical protein OYT88_19150 [Sporolactobacillus sp. CQH2019]|uniref:hypothetical protein n=1 Tax=Sporolactobacillus sp. CQH2019 TaxID=3023512 RepID=UPI0023676233|nr:hypothetical protein [Sporolactobacillus sp. CQH2019]MDD9150647.1 hypothetical protein [Sporolactobacillus sp. CQH2019]
MRLFAISVRLQPDSVRPLLFGASAAGFGATSRCFGASVAGFGATFRYFGAPVAGFGATSTRLDT